MNQTISVIQKRLRDMFLATYFVHNGNHSLVPRGFGPKVAMVTDALNFVHYLAILLKALWTRIWDENVILLQVYVSCINRENVQHTLLFPYHKNAASFDTLCCNAIKTLRTFSWKKTPSIKTSEYRKEFEMVWSFTFPCIIIENIIIPIFVLILNLRLQPQRKFHSNANGPVFV